jgi:hypothetical protein
MGGEREESSALVSDIEVPSRVLNRGNEKKGLLSNPPGRRDKRPFLGGAL